jgi:hypothetical protein
MVFDGLLFFVLSVFLFSASPFHLLGAFLLPHIPQVKTGAG